MTTEQMRELDAWISENVFGWKQFREEEYPHRILWREGELGSEVWDEPHFYTTDAAAAMMVMEKCAEKVGNAAVAICSPTYDRNKKMIENWVVAKIGANPFYGEEAETLPIAIAKFARELFKEESK